MCIQTTLVAGADFNSEPTMTWIVPWLQNNARAVPRKTMQKLQNNARVERERRGEGHTRWASPSGIVPLYSGSRVLLQQGIMPAPLFTQELYTGIMPLMQQPLGERRRWQEFLEAFSDRIITTAIRRTMDMDHGDGSNFATLVIIDPFKIYSSVR